MKPRTFLCLAIFLSFSRLSAQDSLLKTINDSLGAAPRTEYVTGTFKALYIVNLKTIEAPAAGMLNVEIQHRFGAVNSGAYNLFGLDNATLRLGFDYGISDALSIGVGRSSYQKTFDGYVKYKLLRQTGNTEKMPLSVVLLGNMSYYTQHYDQKDYLTDLYRLAYTTQILIARKFSTAFSMEIAPSFIHYNLVPAPEDKNNVFALASGARMKISKRMALTAEYDFLFPNQLVSTPVQNVFSLGWDIETGGHVFQLVFSNSQSMEESQVFGQTIGTWGNGDIYFGFNLSRVFNLKPKKQKSGPALQ